MSNLYAIVQDAQNGQALENLAQQFNISKEEADAAVRELLPALSTGFLSKASEPGALGPILDALGEGQHLAAFADPMAAQEPATAQKGGEILGHLFGPNQGNEQIIQRAAAATGLTPELLAQMLPVIASVLLGGVTKSLQGQGYGGIFTELVNAARQGGLSSILGPLAQGGPPAPNPQPQPGTEPPPASPVSGGGLGSILGQLLRAGASRGNSPQAGAGIGPSPAPAAGLGGILGTLIGTLLGRRPDATSAGPAPASQAPGLDSSAIQAGLDALTKILQPGTPPARAFRAPETEPREAQSAPERSREPEQPPDIQSEIGEILDGKSH